MTANDPSGSPRGLIRSTATGTWRAAVTLALALTLLGQPGAQVTAEADPRGPTAPGSASEHDPQTKRFSVPIEDGHITVEGLGTALLDTFGWNGAEVRWPAVDLRVGGLRGWAAIEALDRALGDSVAIGRRADTVEVEIDLLALRAARHATKQRVGQALGRIVGRDLLARHYVLTLPAELAPDAGPIAIGVHGVESSPACFDALRGAATDSVPFGTFGYANDEAIDRIARELAQRLAAQREQFPTRRFVLVGHSMGGLVARLVVEDPDLDPGNVSAVVQVGTPNQGSRLARMRSGLECVQFVRGLTQRGDASVFSTFSDGLGEAGWDLWPESPFLATLNARPRNPNVRYELLLGNAGILQRPAVAPFRAALHARVAKLPAAKVVAPKIGAWIDDLDEVVAGLGDGAVTVERGRLEGVDEHVLPLTHHGLLRDPTAVAWILDRLTPP